MSSLPNKDKKPVEKKVKKEKNDKKKVNKNLRKELDNLRKSKGFRELGDMLYLDD